VLVFSVFAIYLIFPLAPLEIFLPTTLDVEFSILRFANTDTSLDSPSALRFFKLPLYDHTNVKKDLFKDTANEITALS